MKNLKVILVTTATLLSMADAAHAALYDRGNGMIYDSDQNITWLQDANYANTSGYVAATGGAMTWEYATAWASGLVYQGISGWSLPSANLITPTNNCYAYDGTCDRGPNNTHSQIGHLYYELGNLGAFTSTGVFQPDYGFVHSGSFLNVQNGLYWEKEQDGLWVGSSWYFDTSSGVQASNSSGLQNYAWAVHVGDIAAVPSPAAVWLFSSGLLALAGAALRNLKLINLS